MRIHHLLAALLLLGAGCGNKSKEDKAGGDEPAEAGKAGKSVKVGGIPGLGGVTVEGEGGKVSVGAGGVTTIVDKDGQKAVIEAAGNKVTVTNEKGEVATVTGDGDSTKVVTKDGTFEGGSATKVPDGFPLPVPAGVDVEGAAKSTMPGQGEVHQLTFKTTQSPEEVADFYEKALKEKGFKVQRQAMTSDGNKMASINGTAGKSQAAIVAMLEKDAEDNKTQVIVNFNAR